MSRTSKNSRERTLCEEPPPPGTKSISVARVRDDPEAAAELARAELIPALVQRRAISLDFEGLSVCTQSFLHALLYEAIRVSWAMQAPIYIENARPGVLEGIRLVDDYARGG